MNHDLSQAYWQSRWLAAETGWDLRQPSPPLTEYAAQIPPAQRGLRVLIPGCGSGYEAEFLLENGFPDVTMLDIAPAAVEKMQERFQAKNARPRVLCGDFFEHAEQYDLILEQTFFCALPPALRPAYAQKMRELLSPGGKLAGLLFDRDFPGGPPFGGSREEYRALFAPFFEVKTMETCHNSAAPRAGSEVFFICVRP